ncbi:NAD(P)-binding protein [Calocera cornea HHB12733]|uniref:NAD(P)-binding protein n=1 Tax=Calocera cornea HHB12733 TaxID=1353952 RepID=A0A165EV07_9BASI|nr:NAD(P)-binding protein [Calocera cornea HHB12733]
MSHAEEVVLVTGPSGYIGAATALEALKQGYQVKGTVRSQAKADAFVALYPHAKSMTWVIIPDISAPNAFDEAVKGVDHVLHVAAPFHYASQDLDKDMLEPSLLGTLNALKAAVKEPRVKRVVITSSFAAILDVLQGYRPGYTYDDKDWNSLTWEQVKQIGDPGLAYIAAKTVSETAAWDFVKEHKPNFALTTICPPLVFGPPLQPVESMAKLNQSCGEIWHLMDGTLKEPPKTNFPVWVDVRDIAKMHVDALSKPQTANERYQAIAGHFSFAQIAYQIAQAHPELARAGLVTPSDNSPCPDHYATDSSKAERDFGLGWISFNKCIDDTAAKLLELQKEVGEAAAI